ncbi:MAG: hypothetical protein OXD00_01115 [Gammaproteobacteria bacterium]|nr:hypothetical protein [Gammaproteobacteria bacterium]MCY4322268.1 hypothetical protein [Gammaproteobacteria bacterium]
MRFGKCASRISTTPTINNIYFGTAILSQDSANADWEAVLSSASRLQTLLHVVTDLKDRFDDVLTDLESVAGWKTARVRRPVLILGSLDGIETGVRQLIRSRPLETTSIKIQGMEVTVPTFAEILRIKAFLALKRNATRDYVDFAALSDTLGTKGTVEACRNFDAYYPLDNGQSALQQTIKQLASPVPYDLEQIDLSLFKGLDAQWHHFESVVQQCVAVSIALLHDAAA